jgi:hypothetical protein
MSFFHVTFISLQIVKIWMSSGTEQRTRIWTHTTIPTLFLTKGPKIYDGEKTACSTNAAGKNGYLPAKNWN